jgi:uncharacterized protein (DUF169 family)
VAGATRPRRNKLKAERLEAKEDFRIEQRAGMDAEKPHWDCSLSSTKRGKINVSTEAPSRDAAMNTDWTKLVADLERLLKLRSIPFGMKLFERREEMEAIPRIRRPKAVHTLDQIVAQAARLGWTVGLTSEDLVGAQCRAVVGLGLAKDDKWRSGEHMVGVWYSTPEDSRAHQAAMECVPDGRYEALAVAPLAGGRLDPPDITLFYATPGAMIYFINGLQWSGYKRFDWSIVGESACADSWGRALKTREPSLSIPCYAERRYGGVLDDEMLMALPPDELGKAIAGMEALAKNGLRYPFPQYGIQQDVRAGMAVSYPARDPDRRCPSAEGCGDIAAVDRGDVGGCLERHGMMQKGLSDILRGYFAAEKIARHVALLADTARLSAGGDQFRRQ